MRRAVQVCLHVYLGGLHGGGYVRGRQLSARAIALERGVHRRVDGGPQLLRLGPQLHFGGGELVRLAVGHVRLPEVARLPHGPHGLGPAQLLLDALLLPALVLPGHPLLPGPGQLLPGELQLLFVGPAHRLFQLVHGGADLVGVVRVGALGGLELHQAAAGVPRGGADLGLGAGPAQPGVGLQRGVSIPGGGLGQLELLPLGVGLLLGVLDHLGEGGAALLLLFQGLGQQLILFFLALLLPAHAGHRLNAHGHSPLPISLGTSIPGKSRLRLRKPKGGTPTAKNLSQIALADLFTVPLPYISAEREEKERGEATIFSRRRGRRPPAAPGRRCRWPRTSHIPPGRTW